jgi:hypothetical protein
VRFLCRTIAGFSGALGLAAAHANARGCEFPAFTDWHSSAEHAAATTLRALYHAGDPYESGGFVIEQAGRFRASKPVTQRSRSDVSYCIVLPRDATLAGLYHTHVGHAGFSLRDRRNAKRVGVPSFVGTIRGGAQLVYDPALDSVSALAAPPARQRHAQAAAPIAPRTWLDQVDTALRTAAAYLGAVWEKTLER